MATIKQKSLKEMQQTALNTSNGETVNPKELLKVELLSSFEKYTRCMFKAQLHRRRYRRGLSQDRQRIGSDRRSADDGHEPGR